MQKRDELNPQEPNRIVAHSRNGSGAYRSAGVVAGDTLGKSNTTTVTSAVPTASSPASHHRASVALRIQELPFEMESTIIGTTVSSAKALLKNRSPLNGQYPRPHFVRTATAAAGNDVAKGAITTPQTRKIRIPRTLSNSLLGGTSRVIRNVAINASLVLVKNKATVVHTGHPCCSSASK